MDFDTIRPIISGLLGATVAAWLSVKWAKRLPHANDRGKQTKLARDQKVVICCANIGAGLGLATGLILYFGGFLDSHDWRGLGVTAGLTALLPLLVIVIGNLRGGVRQVGAGLSAYSLAQKTPPTLLFSLMALMLIGGIWALMAFISPN